jgi:hypothetical protein
MSESVVSLPGPFYPTGGHCFTARLAEISAAVGFAQLNENGRPLNGSGATLELIQTLGSGRHTVENGKLYFSTSDNSDPNVNGRVYVLKLGFRVAGASDTDVPFDELEGEDQSSETSDGPIATEKPRPEIPSGYGIPLIFPSQLVPWSKLIRRGATPADIVAGKRQLELRTYPIAGNFNGTDRLDFTITQEGVLFSDAGEKYFTAEFGTFKILLRGEDDRDDDRFCLDICRFVTANIVHSNSDFLLCHPGKSKYPFDAQRLAEKFFYSDQPLGLHCEDGAIFLGHVLHTQGIESRRVWFENLSGNGGGHTILEVRLPASGRWVLVDPDYGVFYQDRQGNMLGAEQINDLRASNFESLEVQFLSVKSWLAGFWNFKGTYTGQFTWTPSKSKTKPTTDATLYRQLIARILSRVHIAELVHLGDGQIRAKNLPPLADVSDNLP